MKTIVYSGTFNPLHEGHMTIINSCKELEGYFMLEVCLDSHGKYARTADQAISDMGDLYLKLCEKVSVTMTDKTLFIDKIVSYYNLGVRDLTFVMGYDTWERIINHESFYRFKPLKEALGIEFDFLVFERDGESVVKGSKGSKFLHPLSFEDFSNRRIDISSSEIRAKNEST